MSIGLIGCAPTEPVDPPKIVIDKTEAVLDIGDTCTIKAQTLTQGDIVTWESSNSMICSVENGVVTAIDSGTAVISATASGETVYCIVEVHVPQTSSGAGYNMTLSKYVLTLKTNETYTLTANVTTVNGETATGGTLTFASSNETVATVTNQGLITAKGLGTANITATYTVGEDWVTSTLRVYVNEDYSIEITPFDQTLYINSELDFVFSVKKNGEPYAYPQDKIIVISSDDTVATYANGKMIGLKAGYVTINVVLVEENIRSTYSFAVIDPSAPEINLSMDSSITVLTESSKDLVVNGASWGTLIYEFANDKFYIEDGKIFAPSEELTTTLTVKHLETKNTITATVISKRFDPCIMSAEDFMLLAEVKSGEAYLGADIDLSEVEWTKITGRRVKEYTLTAACIIDELNVTLDGRGHKITVRYDNEYGADTQIAGIFMNITANGGIKNTIIDFEANYVGGKGTDGTGTQGYKACALTLYNQGTVNDNFINAKFYASGTNGAWRTCGIGYYGGSFHRNIMYAEVYQNYALLTNTTSGSFTFAWEQSGGLDANDNISIAKNLSTSACKFATKDDFMTAWSNTAITNQSTYTSWTINPTENTVALSGTQVDWYKDPALAVSAPENVKYSNGSYTWDPVANALSYNVRVLAESTQVGTIKQTTLEEFNFSAWLKSLDSTTLNSLDGKKMYVQVQTVVSGDKSDFSTPTQLVNYSNTNSPVNGTIIKLVNSVQTLRSAINTNRWNGYYVLTQDIVLTEEQTEELIINDNNIQTVGISSEAQTEHKERGTGKSYLVYTSLRGTVDGLGHTISYVINDSSFTGTWCGLFHNLRGGSDVLNLNLKGEITRSYPTGQQSYFNCALVEYNFGGNIHASNFDFKLTTTQDTTTDFTRTCVIRTASETSNKPEISSRFSNCLFNIRSYTHSGVIRENRGQNGETEGAVLGEGSGATLINSAYIANTSTGNKHSGATCENTQSYADLTAFITAWQNDTLANKETYENAGWSVDGNKIKFWLIAIN